MLYRLRVALRCALLAALTGVAVQAILLLHAATKASRALPGAMSGEIQTTRAVLVAQVAAARGDLTGQIEAARKDLERIEGKLANEQFLQKAPPEEVEKQRGRADELRAEIERLSELP